MSSSMSSWSEKHLKEDSEDIKKAFPDIKVMRELKKDLNQNMRMYKHALVKGAITQIAGEWRNCWTKIILMPDEKAESFEVYLDIEPVQSTLLIYYARISINNFIEILDGLLYNKPFTIGNYAIKVTKGTFQDTSTGRPHFVNSRATQQDAFFEGIEWANNHYVFLEYGETFTLHHIISAEKLSIKGYPEDVYEVITKLVNIDRVSSATRHYVHIILPNYHARIVSCRIEGKIVNVEVKPFCADLKDLYLTVRVTKPKDVPPKAFLPLTDKRISVKFEKEVEAIKSLLLTKEGYIIDEGLYAKEEEYVFPHLKELEELGTVREYKG